MHGRIKAPSAKEDQLNAIQESRKHLEKEYRFKFVKSIPERIKAVIKDLGRAIK